MTEILINFDCAACGQNLEAVEEMRGAAITCPACKNVIQVPINKPQAKAKRLRIEKKSDRAGTGCLIQFLGVVILFVFCPISILAGIILAITLLVIGARMAEYYACPACRNKLVSGDVTLCPSCHTELAAYEMSAGLIAFFIITAGLILFAIVMSSGS